MTNFVTTDFFATYGMRLASGRLLTQEDTTGRPVVVISRALADAAWPGESALGKRLRAENEWREVVGVLENATYTTLEEPPMPIVYAPVRQDVIGFSMPTAVSIRTAVDPTSMANAVRSALQGLDATAPVFNVVTMAERAARVTARYRYSAALMGAMALLALLMAAMGTYGVLAYAVAARTREIGIRIALGAHPADVLRLVVGSGARMAVAGIALGLVGTYAATRVLGALLYQVSPADPVTFIAIAVLMSIVAVIASYVPARRALKVDPVVALRAE